MNDYKLGTNLLNGTSVPVMLAKGRITPIAELPNMPGPAPDVLINIISDMLAWHPALSMAASKVDPEGGYYHEDVQYLPPI